MITQRIDDDATESMNEGRGLCRVLAVGVLLAVAGLCFGDVVLTPDVLLPVQRADAAYQASSAMAAASPTTTVSFAEAAVVVVTVSTNTVVAVDFSAADYSKGYPVMQVWLDYPALGPVVTLASGNLEYVGDEPDLTVTTAGTRQYLSFMAVGAGRKILCSKWHQTEGE